eukprot:TRINITY_DN21195_c1_g1_i1.p1 TRINITY_DN21195_c1_g1~~TRINITY_DN21195_c1_g1_i1.p1  ORF type:complete len:310 (+),score=62.89 TRINITY_DN21195_c1_g1_i1:67-930(+)
MSAEAKTVLITGGSGNLGLKACAALAGRCAVKVLDLKKPACADSKVHWVKADLTQWNEDWARAFGGCDVVLHMAAVNPYLDCTWEQSSASIAVHANVLRACERHRVKRVVVFSSNHVMGGYRRLSELIHPTSPVRPGTRFTIAGVTTDGGPYAVAKMAGESLFKAASGATAVQVIVVRIGWCQPGDNSPATITASGQPPGHDGVAVKSSDDDDPDALQRWFLQMWLSNEDYSHLLEQCVWQELPRAKRFMIVNGMSRNAGARWVLDSEEAIALGFDPKDDSTKSAKL